MFMDDRLAIGISETCKAIGLSRSSVFELIRQGKIPVVRIGRRTLVPVEGLREFLRLNTAKSSLTAGSGGVR
jgi:excisionase family DNA binding protein